MDELRAIVQRMIETGRSEEEISTVVQNYQKEKGFTKNDFVQSIPGITIEEPTPQSDDGSLELQKENKLKYNISNDKNGILDFLVSDKP